MRQADDLYVRLREADPAADIDTDPTGPRARRIKARALASVSRRRVPRKRLVVSLAAAIMMLGGVAVATGTFEPDPVDIASILDQAVEEGRHDVKTEGWRPNLRTEQIWCAYQDGTVGSTRTFEFALDEPMTEQHLIVACTEGPDQHRAQGGDEPDSFTICEAYAPADELRRAIDSPGRWTDVSGDVSGERPGFPVVLGWDADCSEVTLDTNAPAVELRGDWTSMEPVNHAREVEIGLTAVAIDGCLSSDEAYGMAREAQERLHGDWLVAHRSQEQPSCHRVWVNPQLGTLEIGSRS